MPVINLLVARISDLLAEAIVSIGRKQDRGVVIETGVWTTSLLPARGAQGRRCKVLVMKIAEDMRIATGRITDNVPEQASSRPSAIVSAASTSNTNRASHCLVAALARGPT
jgi:hypothetical protein